MNSRRGADGTGAAGCVDLVSPDRMRVRTVSAS